MRFNSTLRLVLTFAAGLGLLGLVRVYYEFLMSSQGRRVLDWFDRHPLWLLALIPLAAMVSGVAAWLTRRAGARQLVIPVAVLTGALTTSIYNSLIGLVVGLVMGLAFAFRRLDRFVFNTSFGIVFSGLLLAVTMVTGRFARASYFSDFRFALAATIAIYVLGAAVVVALVITARPMRLGLLRRVLSVPERQRRAAVRVVTVGTSLVWACGLVAAGVWMGWQWDIVRRMAALEQVGRANFVWAGGSILDIPQSISLGPKSISLAHEARDEHLRLLRGIPNVTDLFIHDAQVTDDGFRNIGSLRQLLQLRLYRVPIHDETIQRFAGLPWLQHLEIDDVPVTRRVFHMLPTLPSLVECTIHNILPEGPSIEKVTLPSGLSHIDWSDCGLSDGDLACLDGHQAVVWLFLSNNQIQGPGLARISKCIWLRYIDLSNNPIDDQHLSHLTSLPIDRLVLDGVRLTDAGARALGQLPRLSYFSARGSGISARHLHQITASTALQSAVVDAFNLSPRDMLGGPRPLADLKLFVDGQSLESADIARLAQLGRRVTLDACELTPGAVAELPHHFGLLRGSELILYDCHYDERFAEVVWRYARLE